MTALEYIFTLPEAALLRRLATYQTAPTLPELITERMPGASYSYLYQLLRKLEAGGHVIRHTTNKHNVGYPCPIIHWSIAPALQEMFSP